MTTSGNTEACHWSCCMPGGLNNVNHAHKYWLITPKKSHSNAFTYTLSLRSVNFSVNRSRVLSDVCLLWACWRSCHMSGDLNDVNHAHKYWL